METTAEATYIRVTYHRERLTPMDLASVFATLDEDSMRGIIHEIMDPAIIRALGEENLYCTYGGDGRNIEFENAGPITPAEVAVRLHAAGIHAFDVAVFTAPNLGRPLEAAVR